MGLFFYVYRHRYRHLCTRLLVYSFTCLRGGGWAKRKEKREKRQEKLKALRGIGNVEDKEMRRKTGGLFIFRYLGKVR